MKAIAIIVLCVDVLIAAFLIMSDTHTPVPADRAQTRSNVTGAAAHAELHLGGTQR